MKNAAIAANSNCLKNSITFSGKVSGFFLSFFFQNFNMLNLLLLVSVGLLSIF